MRLHRPRLAYAAAIVITTAVTVSGQAATNPLIDAAADTYIVRSDVATPHGTESLLQAWNQGGLSAIDRVTFVRFDLPVAGNAGTYSDASLSLSVVSVPSALNLIVLGIPNGNGDEGFDQATLTPNTSTLFDDSLDIIDESQATNLGALALSAADNGTVVSFASAALDSFINDDTNSNVAFVLLQQGDILSASTFAATEHGSLAPPRLSATLTVPTPASIAILLPAAFAAVLRRRRIC